MQAKDLLGALLVTLAWAPAQPPASARSESRPATRKLAFAWPVPSEAIVTETVLKQGREAKTRYRVTLEPTDVPAELRVRLTEFEFLELEGVDLNDPKVKAQLAPALAMASAIPDLVVGRDGAMLRIVGYDMMLARLAEMLRKTKGNAEADRFTSLMRTPKMVAVLEQSSAVFWGCWAASWIGLELGPEEERTADVAVPVAGATLKARATFRNHGPCDPDGCLRLSVEHQVVDAEQQRSVLEFARTLSRGALGGSDLDIDKVDVVRLVSLAEIVAEPRTMRPRTASYEKGIAVKLKDGAVKSLVERHEYAFEWKAQREKK